MRELSRSKLYHFLTRDDPCSLPLDIWKKYCGGYLKISFFYLFWIYKMRRVYTFLSLIVILNWCALPALAQTSYFSEFLHTGELKVALRTGSNLAELPYSEIEVIIFGGHAGKGVASFFNDDVVVCRVHFEMSSMKKDPNEEYDEVSLKISGIEDSRDDCVSGERMIVSLHPDQQNHLFKFLHNEDIKTLQVNPFNIFETVYENLEACQTAQWTGDVWFFASLFECHSKAAVLHFLEGRNVIFYQPQTLFRDGMVVLRIEQNIGKFEQLRWDSEARELSNEERAILSSAPQKTVVECRLDNAENIREDNRYFAQLVSVSPGYIELNCMQPE